MSIIHKMAERSGKYIAKELNQGTKEELTYIYFFRKFYGYMTSLILILTSVIMISTITKDIKYYFYFLLIYVLVFVFRTTLGGIHFDNDYICTITTVSINVAGTVIIPLLSLNFWFVVLNYMYTFLIIYNIGVVDHKNKPLSKERKRKCKIKGLIFFWILIMLNILLPIKEFTNGVFYTLIITNLNILIGSKYRREDLHVEQ